jgi:hypothetical protein
VPRGQHTRAYPQTDRANEYLLTRYPLRQEERDQTERTASILFSSTHEYPQSLFGVQFGRTVVSVRTWNRVKDE